MKKYGFIIFVLILVSSYFLYDYFKEGTDTINGSQTEPSRKNDNQKQQIESEEKNDEKTEIKEHYLDEKYVDKIYITFIRSGEVDEHLKKILEWDKFRELMGIYSLKLKKDNEPIKDPDFIMFFFVDKLFKDEVYFEKNYEVKYYTVLYKTPVTTSFQGEEVEFDALSFTFDTISKRFILYLKNGDTLIPYVIHENPEAFLKLIDQIDENTYISD